jgi:hypothetical protein
VRADDKGKEWRRVLFVFEDLNFYVRPNRTDVFCTKFKILCGTLSNVTCLVSLFGQPNSALLDMETKIRDKILVFCAC